jgi:hypothetical protein
VSDNPDILSSPTQNIGGQAQTNAFLQLFKRLVIAEESEAAASALYNQLPFAAAGNLVVATVFPGVAKGTIIIAQTVAAALDVTLNGAGPWIVVDGAGAAAANHITVKGAGGATILGAASYAITSNWGSATFVLFGTNYLVVGKS